MDFEDFLVSNLLLPLGSLCFVIFSTSKKAWGFDNFITEANAGKGLKIQRWMRFYLTYILPLIISMLFVVGLINYFKRKNKV